MEALMNFIITVVLLWLFVAFPIWMLIDCLRSNTKGIFGRMVWSVFILLIPFFGAVIYGLFSSKLKPHKWLAVISVVLVIIGFYRLTTFAMRFPGFRPSDVKNLQEAPAKKSDQIPTTDADFSNAASGYIRAQKLEKYPESKEVRDRLKKIAEEGWTASDHEATNILADNEACLAEVVRAAALKNCDFYFGTYKEGKLNEIPKYSHTVFFSHLSLLKARHLENQKQDNQALKYFIAPLRMASQIGSNPDTIAGAIATAISGPAIRSLRNYLSRTPQLNREDVQILKSALTSFQGQLFQPTRFMENEKKNTWAILNLLADSPNEFEWANGKDPMVMALQSEQIRKRSAELVNEIYDLFIQAAGSNQEDDWNAAIKHMKALNKHPQIITTGVIKALYAGLRLDEEAYVKAYVDPVLKITLSMAVPDLRKIVVKHHDMLKDLEGLKGDLNTRLKVA